MDDDGMLRYGGSGPGSLPKFDAEVSIIQFVDRLIRQSYLARASDIHLDPQKDALVVRIRVDGFLRESHRIPMRLHDEIIARIKILAGLRTDEHQSAHDGRFAVEVEGSSVDVRVSIVPTYHGENCILRLLSDLSQDFTLARLGCTHAQREQIAQAVRSPHGMILTTGPTGSGKTTTLYTMLKMVSKPEISVVTIEDPIEYAIPGITQIPVHQGGSMSFATGLRAVVRQDPDIIMVGEIRDDETARLATNAALTGHLVFSTMHTNDAVTALVRLIDMNVEPYLIASTVRLVIGQRLVRRVCARCKMPHKISSNDKKIFEGLVPEDDLRQLGVQYIGKGCESCDKTGFSGRIAIPEVLVVDQEIRDAVINKSSSDILTQVARKRGMIPMMVDACTKVRAGVTSLDEVVRMHYA